MVATEATSEFMDGIILFVKSTMVYAMIAGFFAAIGLRTLIYYTVKREKWFADEFEKRVAYFLEGDHNSGPHSFYVTVKRLLEKTFYELFEIRGIMKRRRLDYITDPTDRLFLIQHGSAHLVRDTLRQVRFLRYGNDKPDLLAISKAVFQENACFNKVFGVLPVGLFNDVLNVAPGLFIIFGIFGTFLGIMQGLKGLGGMDLTDVEATKIVMDTFLIKISFSMETSAVGILLSVVSTIFNTVVSPEKLFYKTVSKYERCIDTLWHRCENNILPEQMVHFDEHRDPVEALAEISVTKQLASRPDEESPYMGRDRAPTPNVKADISTAPAIARPPTPVPTEKKAS